MPNDVRLAPGPHVISLSHYGYREQQLTFDVPESLSEPLPLTIALTPQSEDERRREATAPRNAAKWLHIAGASAMAALGSAALIAGAIALARDSECTAHTPAGTCVSRRRTTSPGLGYTIAGSAALAGAVSWGLWIALDARATRVTAAVPFPFDGRHLSLLRPPHNPTRTETTP